MRTTLSDNSKHSASFRKVAGIYPSKLLQRRNTDYLYHHALKDLYSRMGLPFEIIEGFYYNLIATFLYQATNRAERLGLKTLRSSCARALMHLPIPSQYLDDSTLFHGSFFGLPANVKQNVVLETEFYDFDQVPGAVPFRVNALSDGDLERMHAIIVRTTLSRDHFRRQYPARFHSLARVAPFHMPYLARWEARQPAKPSAAEYLNFIFVGNQARRKGLDLYIRFAAEVRKRDTRRKLKFVVVSNFQDGADFDLSGLEVHQGLGGEAVQDLMEKSHYLMLPTRRDSHPKVCYEAAATGCGLILSDIRPMFDIWGANSYVFPLAQGEDAMGSLAAEVVTDRLDPVRIGQDNRKLFFDEFCPSASTRIHRQAVFG